VDDAPVEDGGDPARVRAEIVELVRELGIGLDRVGHAFAARSGLHPTDLAALVAVMHAESRGAPITAGELTARLGVTSGAVTGVVDRLERGGHLRRRRDDRDRRRVYLHYAEEGRRVATAFFGPLGARSDRMMDEFDDAELAVVHRFLTRMGEVVRDHAPDPPGPADA
jgi:DNA-binding MarR family transcriptional regulator